ncbi:hypothetical protein C8R46DRAFT_1039146 [Mycena filopes]|nr:hypothetical protein C8R46DRAFT_1039146 [Mycena filopes]
MSLRRLFVAAASILACMTSVQTPKVDDAGLSILPSIPHLPILPVCVGDEDRRLPVSRANFSAGDYDAYLFLGPVFHVVHVDSSNPTQPASKPSTLALLRINVDLPDIDLDKLQLVYLFTASFARFLKRTTRLRWSDVLRAVCVLGGMAMTAGFGSDDQNKTTEELASLIRPTIASLYESTRSPYYQLQRTARNVQNLSRSLNFRYLLNFVPLPFDIPLEHLIYALALNGLIVWILKRFTLGRRLLSTLFPDPTPWIRRTKKRYKRGPKNKNKPT